MFNNDYIHIDNNGIDLLRNKFPYHHIDYSNVDSFRVIDGYLLRNRLIILIFALGLIFISLLIFVNHIFIYKDFFNFNIQSTRSIKGLGLVLFASPVIMIFGVIMLWQSFIKSKILQIFTDNKTFNIRIREIEKKGNLDDLVNFLDKKIMK